METDRKVRTVVNHYRKNILKKYFQVWKKYSEHKLQYTRKLIQLQRNSSNFGSKPIVHFDGKIFDLRKNKNDQTEKKETVFTKNISRINKHLDNRIKEETIKLRHFILRKFWKRYSLIAINKQHRRIENEKKTAEQSIKYKSSRNNIIIVYNALLLFKTTWKIWYKYSYSNEIKKKK